ncbi:pentapeptide repeat-containing protein [Halobacteriovorax sp. RZ-2]|uniref:pentapeptide repeat-containing protein n=1 Tax=unclassified Halobacteriovorax TaxID=2639665 RepID=UPI003713FE83
MKILITTILMLLALQTESYARSCKDNTNKDLIFLYEHHMPNLYGHPSKGNHPLGEIEQRKLIRQNLEDYRNPKTGKEPRIWENSHIFNGLGSDYYDDFNVFKQIPECTNFIAIVDDSTYHKQDGELYVNFEWRMKNTNSNSSYVRSTCHCIDLVQIGHENSIYMKELASKVSGGYCHADTLEQTLECIKNFAPTSSSDREKATGWTIHLPDPPRDNSSSDSTSKYSSWDDKNKECTFSRGGKTGLNQVSSYEEMKELEHYQCFDFTSIDLNSAPYNKLDIYSKDITGSKFGDTTFQSKTFKQSEGISNVEFNGTSFKNVIFETNVSNVKFSYNNLNEVTFRRQFHTNNLTDATINRINILNRGCDNGKGINTIKDSNITGSKFSEKYGGCSNHILGLEIDNTKIEDSTFENIIFSRLKLISVDISNSNFSNTKANSTNIQHSNFNKNIFESTFLSNGLLYRNRFQNNRISLLKIDKMSEVTSNEFIDDKISQLGFFQVRKLEDFKIKGRNPGDIIFNDINADSIDFSNAVYNYSFTKTTLDGSNFTPGPNGTFNSSISFDGSSCKSCNFSNQFVSKISIKNSNLSNSKFEDFSTKSFDSIKSNLDNANFEKANLGKVTIKNSEFENSNLSNATTSENSTLTSSNFNGASLKAMTLRKADLSNSTFNSANLQRVKFSEDTKFYNNEFSGVDFYGVSFSNLIFDKASFVGAQNIGKTTYGTSDLTLSNVNMNNANFHGDFKGLKVSNSLFINASFNGGTITGKIERADFSFVKFKGTNIGNSIKTEIKNSIFDNTTIEGTIQATFNNTSFINSELSKTSIRESNFVDVNLTDARLGNAHIYKSEFNSSNLTNTLFDGATFINTKIYNSKMIYTSLYGASVDLEITQSTLKDVYGLDAITGPLHYATLNISDSQLDGLNFANSHIQHSSFRNSSLKNVDFSGAILKNIEFNDVNLSDANLTNTSFESLEIKGSILHRVDFNGAEFSSFEINNSDLSASRYINGANWYISGKASFDNSKLDDLIFSNLNLIGVSFKGASLEYALFNKALLQDADFTGANLYETDFTGANTTGANFNTDTSYTYGL